MKGVFVFLLRTQRAAAPVWRSLIGASGPCCRFHPTCSVYAEEAMVRHGLWRGLGMALYRLVRCHPWGGAGWDPVEKGSS